MLRGSGPGRASCVGLGEEAILEGARVSWTNRVLGTCGSWQKRALGTVWHVLEAVDTEGYRSPTLRSPVLLPLAQGSERAVTIQHFPEVDGECSFLDQGSVLLAPHQGSCNGDC